jgi:hypothetical protein
MKNHQRHWVPACAAVVALSIIPATSVEAQETGSWQVAVLWKNMTDEKILSFGGDTPLSGTTFMVKSNYAFYGPGETISLQALFRF